MATRQIKMPEKHEPEPEVHQFSQASARKLGRDLRQVETARPRGRIDRPKKARRPWTENEEGFPLLHVTV